MEQVRKGFEEWAAAQMGIDFSTMRFGPLGKSGKELYIDESDEDGAMIVSAMLYAYRAGRADKAVQDA